MQFATFAAKRTFHYLIVAIIVSLMIFFLFRSMPGERVYFPSPDGTIPITFEELLRLREEYGLNDPLVVQYFHWLGDFFTGDWGETTIDYSD